MGSKQIRTGQLIAPFGPGSLYTDRRGTPHVVAGLDFWFKLLDQGSGKMVECSDKTEFELFEPRLSTLLRVDRFFVPPDYRHLRMGETPPPNAGIKIPALRFPRWYRHTRTGEMKRFNLHTVRPDTPQGGGRWQPVRFISVCPGGHLSEFPWKSWIGCTCPGDGDLILTDRGGSELTSVRVHCRSCATGSVGRKGGHLGGTTVKPNVLNGEQSAFQRAGINCPGDRPWLGENSSETGCHEPLVGALINQTNLYFPRTVSALALPDLQLQDSAVAKLRSEIERLPSLGMAKTFWRMPDTESAIVYVQNKLSKLGIECTTKQVEEALGSLFSDIATVPAGTKEPTNPEPTLLSFRRAEFNIIRNTVDDPSIVPDLRVINTHVPDELKEWIEKVNLVERLRETRVFYGFDRLEQGGDPLAGMPDTAMGQLFRNPLTESQERWLPATNVFGEGIYLELREDFLTMWQEQNAAWLDERVNEAFIMRLSGIHQTLPPLAGVDRAWASRYLLVHSLAHVLTNQFVFECGYSTASLRERLYISADHSAPMAGLLIYTAAGDAEGTLGGLVRLGHSDRLAPVVRRALNRASWCSADPVCSESLGGTGSKRANLAACHACVLLPETSCETINQGLDRALLVGTPENRRPGFFANLVR